MVAVEPGDRVLLRTDGGHLALRVLHRTELVGAWRVHVLAPVGRAGRLAGLLEVTGPAGGVVRLPARLALVDGALVLESGHAEEPTGTLTAPQGGQRRDDVRGEVQLPVRVAALDAAAERALRGGVHSGHTLDVSAGGVRLDMPGLRDAPARAARLYLELTLPGGELAPAVVAVVDGTVDGTVGARLGKGAGSGTTVQTRFLDLAPLDRERIVRLVFDAERRLLAERRSRLT